MDATPPPIVTQEIRIVDAQGHTRMTLSASTGAPTLLLLTADGKPGAEISLSNAGYPVVKLSNPDPQKPDAALEVDDKGAHVKFDRTGGSLPEQRRRLGCGIDRSPWDQENGDTRQCRWDHHHQTL